MSDPREAKLPRWAQSELERLRTQVRLLERGVAERDEKIEHPAIFLDPYGYNKEPRPIATKGHYVLFKLSEHLDAVVHQVDDYLIVRTDGGRLAVYPHVTNVVHIKVESR